MGTVGMVSQANGAENYKEIINIILIKVLINFFSSLVSLKDAQ